MVYCYTSKYRIGWLPFYKSVKKSWKVSHGLIFPWCNFMPIVGLISFKVWPTTYDQQELPLVINSRFIGGARLHRYAIKITSERCLISCLSSDITKLTNTLGDIYVKHPGVEYEQIKSKCVPWKQRRWQGDCKFKLNRKRFKNGSYWQILTKTTVRKSRAQSTVWLGLYWQKSKPSP